MVRLLYTNIFFKNTGAPKPPLKPRMCASDEPRRVSCGQAVVLCAAPPSEELLHAVKQTVVSVWPFQWGIFSPPQNRAKKQNVNLETKRKKQSDKCHHYATISAGTARPSPLPPPLAPTRTQTHVVPQPLPLSSTLGCAEHICNTHTHTNIKM